jgi:hypothetical protein
MFSCSHVHRFSSSSPGGPGFKVAGRTGDRSEELRKWSQTSPEPRRSQEKGRKRAEEEEVDEGGRGRRAGGKSHKNPKRSTSLPTKYHLIHYN